jgi:hypothetical protein
MHSLDSNFLAQKGDVQKPSRDEAMKYFSKYVEPRRLEVRDDAGKLLSHRLAKPHERHLGKPYKYWHTGADDFAQFGVGVGLYFYLLKGLFLLCAALWALYTPVMRYYSSTTYSDEQFPVSLRGSALCTRRKFVHLDTFEDHFPSKAPTMGPTSRFSRLRKTPTYAPTPPLDGWVNDCPMADDISYTVFASFCLVVGFIAGSINRPR